METRWSALAAIWCLGVGLVVSPAVAMAPEAAGGFFRAEWSVPALPPAFTKIEGYVYNDSRLRVTDVRLRVASLDTAGRAVGQTMGWSSATSRRAAVPTSRSRSRRPRQRTE
jgi:hypothetical protein